MFLEDIFESIENMEKHTKGFSKSKFYSNEQTIDAVIRRFEVIGEATKHIPLKIKRKYFEVAWRKMASMRNVLIHEYFGVDKNKLWKTIKEDIPGLKEKIDGMLKEYKNQRLL